MKTVLLVGASEQHRLTIEQLWAGPVVIRVDGVQVAKGALKRNKSLSATIGESERHSVNVRKRGAGFACWDIEVDHKILPPDGRAERLGRVATARLAIALISVIHGMAGLGFWMVDFSIGGVQPEDRAILAVMMGGLVLFAILFVGTGSRKAILRSVSLVVAGALLGINAFGSFVVAILHGRIPFSIGIIINVFAFAAVNRGWVAHRGLRQISKKAQPQEGAYPDSVRVLPLEE